MNRVAIAFSTKDRVELSRHSIEPLLQPNKFDLWWVDGSTTAEGESFAAGKMDNSSWNNHFRANVRGGADPAIVCSLTEMLKHREPYTDGVPEGNFPGMRMPGSLHDYSYVGLVENDVLLTDPKWFERTMDLFDFGGDDGLKVGAVSARCYEDRVLLQRPDYAVMHNIGAGMIILTREAAELILKYARTGWTNANRLLFSQLSGLDIGGWWAFRGSSHILCMDWGFDVVLAAHGLASLALTPSPVEMIGQTPSLAEQGLTIAGKSVTDRIDDDAFQRYCDNTQAIREGTFKPAWPGLFHTEPGTSVIFPHQVQYLGGDYTGDWILKWTMGFGPFAWKAGAGQPDLSVPILGSCDVLVSGGNAGGKVQVVDRSSGFKASPTLKPEGDEGQVLALNVPSGCGYREIELTCLTPGVVFYGIKCREPQPYNPTLSFDHSWLPPCG